VRRERASRRDPVAPLERGLPFRAPEGLEAIDRVARGGQVGAEPVDEGEMHASILADLRIR